MKRIVQWLNLGLSLLAVILSLVAIYRVEAAPHRWASGEADYFRQREQDVVDNLKQRLTPVFREFKVPIPEDPQRLEELFIPFSEMIRKITG